MEFVSVHPLGPYLAACEGESTQIGCTDPFWGISS